MDFLFFYLFFELPGDPLFIEVKSSLLIPPFYFSFAFYCYIRWLLFIDNLLFIFHSKKKKFSQQTSSTGTYLLEICPRVNWI
jgi:hypothetical protein